VFLNACQTAQEINSSQMVNEFISYGATHIIGTLWSVRDEPASDFAKVFYDNVLADKKRSIGEALRLTRDHFSKKTQNAEAVTWPAFILYGNPNTPFKRAPA
jgi:CHAT domain-containing protein